MSDSQTPSRRWSRLQRHPNDELLFAAFNGETRESETNRVRQHLTECWECATLWESWNQARADYMLYKHASEESMPTPPGGWASFQPNLRALSAELRAKQRPLFHDIFRAGFLEHWRRWALVASTALVLTAAFALFLRTPSTPEGASGLLTASGLLVRAESNEELKPAGQTVHQKIGIRHKNRSATIDVWRGSTHPRPTAYSGDSSVSAGLERALTANRMDPHHPLSAAAFGAWRNSIVTPRENLAQTIDQSSWTLTTHDDAHAPGMLAEASLTVRAIDWRPVEARLVLESESDGTDEYDLTEIAYEVLPSEPLDSVAALPPVSAPEPAAGPVTLPPMPSDAELNDAEMQVRMALNLASADLGEAVEVNRTSRQIRLTGLVSSDQIKRSLVASLTDSPLVTVELQTVEEAIALDNQAQPLSGTPQHDVFSAQPPMQEYVVRHFAANPTAVEHFLNTSVSLSDAALSHAWALRRLAQRYTGTEVAKLTTKSRQNLETLIRGHVAEIRKQVDGELTLLEPVLSGAVKDRASALDDKTPSITEWPAIAESLFDSVQRVDRLVRGLFAGAGLPMDGISQTGGQPLRMPAPQDYAATLLAVLDRLETTLPKISERLGSEFLEPVRKN
jgi:hypothetical protein